MTNTSSWAITENRRDETIAAQAPSVVTVRTVRGMEGLLSLQPTWNEIAAAQPNLRFHHAYSWHLSYLRNLEQDAASVHFFAFARGNRPIAIIPLRRVYRTLNRIPLWLWEFPHHPHTDLCDCLIANPADGPLILQMLWDTLRSRPEQPWDALHLPRLLDDAPILSALKAERDVRSCLKKIGQSMYFSCADMESAMRNNSGQFKRNLRRQRKRLECLGHLEVSLVQDGAALEQAFQSFLDVEASGWKGGAGRGSAIRLSPHLVEFYRELMSHFSADRRCLISLLKLNDRVIAAQFCLLAGSTLYLLKIAYDEAYKADAPGNQLLFAVLEHCCRSPDITTLSLVTGPSWAVGRWNPEAQDLWSTHLFNDSLLGLVAYGAARLRAALAIARTRFHAALGRQSARAPQHPQKSSLG